MSMITRIASRYFHSFQGNEADYEEESETKKKKGPPPHWDEFLKAKYSDGKKKVPNTNPKTKDRFHQVTMQTLFKSDDGFKKRVMKEYSDWMKNQSQSDTDKKAPSPSKKSQPAKQSIPFEVLGSHDEVEAFREKHAAAIKAAVNYFNIRKAYYQQQVEGGSPILSEYSLRSPNEKGSFTKDVQILARASGDVGNTFVEEFTSTYRSVSGMFSRWRDSNGNFSSIAMQDWVAGKPTILSAAEKTALRDQYLFTQAFFKAAGITHVTVFRGIKGKGLDKDPPSEGDSVDVGARSLSCWSMDLNVAKGFGDRCCIAKVPVEQVFASPLTDPEFGHGSELGESEFILMPAKGKEHIPVTIGGFNK